MSRQLAGDMAELEASCWLMRNGYHVFKNVSQHGPADIIAAKGGEVVLIDVKSIGKPMYKGRPYYKASAWRLTEEQVRMGVVLLHAFSEDGVSFFSFDKEEMNEWLICNGYNKGHSK